MIYAHEFQDTFPTLLESTVRLLHQLLCTWKNSILMERKKELPESFQKQPTNSSNNNNNNSSSSSENRALISPVFNSTSVYAMHCIEGFAIVLLCQLRPQIKKIAISLMKETKQMLQLLNHTVRNFSGFQTNNVKYLSNIFEIKKNDVYSFFPTKKGVDRSAKKINN